MKTKEIYVKPEIVLIELEPVMVIASSLGMEEDADTHPARIRRRSFWGDDEEL